MLTSRSFELHTRKENVPNARDVMFHNFGGALLERNHIIMTVMKSSLLKASIKFICSYSLLEVGLAQWV
jgi:hypothetical protein